MCHQAITADIKKLMSDGKSRTYKEIAHKIYTLPSSAIMPCRKLEHTGFLEYDHNLATYKKSQEYKEKELNAQTIILDLLITLILIYGPMLLIFLCSTS